MQDYKRVLFQDDRLRGWEHDSQEKAIMPSFFHFISKLYREVFIHQAEGRPRLL